MGRLPHVLLALGLLATACLLAYALLAPMHSVGPRADVRDAAPVETPPLDIAALDAVPLDERTRGAELHGDGWRRVVGTSATEVARLAVRVSTTDGEVPADPIVQLRALKRYRGGRAEVAWRLSASAAPEPGTFVFERAPCGVACYLVVSGRGCFTNSQCVHVEQAVEGFTVPVVLEPWASVRGRVTDVRDAGIEGAALSVKGGTLLDADAYHPADRMSPTGWSRLRSGGDGAFLLEGLPANTMLFLHAGKKGYEGTRTPPLRLVPREVRCVDVQLARATRVRGRVAPLDGLEDVTVTIRSDPLGPQRRVTPTPDGSFLLWNVAPGRATVTVRAQGEGRVVRIQTTVDVVAHALNDIGTLELGGGVPLRLEVHVDGGGCAAARCRLTPPGVSNAAAAFARRPGSLLPGWEFVIPVDTPTVIEGAPPGDVQLTCTTVSSGFAFLQGRRGGGAAHVPEQVWISAAERSVHHKVLIRSSRPSAQSPGCILDLQLPAPDAAEDGPIALELRVFQGDAMVAYKRVPSAGSTVRVEAICRNAGPAEVYVVGPDGYAGPLAVWMGLSAVPTALEVRRWRPLAQARAAVRDAAGVAQPGARLAVSQGGSEARLVGVQRLVTTDALGQVLVPLLPGIPAEVILRLGIPFHTRALDGVPDAPYASPARPVKVTVPGDKLISGAIHDVELRAGAR